MKKSFALMSVLIMSLCAMAQQVENSNFEDWSAPVFNKKYPQPAIWHASNVEQFGLKFNFAHQEKGHTGKYCLMVQDQSVGAAGIEETSPGYFSLGYPWIFIDNLFKVKYATAGTYGGIDWSWRPDTMSVWIRRTGDNTDKEDFYLLYYAWRGTAKGTSYKAKNGKCTEVEHINEESDIRQALNWNECNTSQNATQVAEGMWREKKTYGEWTNIRVPIYYMNSQVPQMMNLIFSASNYPNFRANTGLYAGNSLYIDDIEFIYSDKIHTLVLDGKAWKGFDMNATGVQVCHVGEDGKMPEKIECWRGAGQLTNEHGNTAKFKGRKLDSKEVTIVPGELGGKPTIITVTSGDGKTKRTYQIKFVK